MTLTLRLTITTWRYKTRFYDTYRPTCYGDPLVIPSRTQNRSKWACMYLRSAFFKIDFEMCLTADARRLPFWAMEKGDTRYPRWYLYAHWTSITVYLLNTKANSNHTGFHITFLFTVTTFFLVLVYWPLWMSSQPTRKKGVTVKKPVIHTRPLDTGNL